MTVLQNTCPTLSNVFVGYHNDNGNASAAHQGDTRKCCTFFGLLSLTGFRFAVLL